MSLLDLSAQFTQKSLNELYDTKNYEYLVSPATIGAPPMKFHAAPPITAAEAKHQKAADGVFNDMPMPSPSLSVADFTVTSADMNDLNKPTPISKFPRFLPDPNIKAFENLYEQELERQNQFFAGFEEAKREGDFRRRAYLQAKGFAEGEIDEIMKETRKREGLKALDEGLKYVPGGDLTFQHDIRRMVERVPEAPAAAGAGDVIPTVEPATVSAPEPEMKLKPSDLRRYEETSAITPLATHGQSAYGVRPYPIMTPEGLGLAVKVKRKKEVAPGSAAAPMVSPKGGSAV